MNEIFTDGKIVALGTSVIGALVWIVYKGFKHDLAKNSARLAQQSERIALLEKHAVTRPEFARAMEKQNELQEKRHASNTGLLTRIEDKIDLNEERASKTRQELRDNVHRLATKVAVLAGRADDRD